MQSWNRVLLLGLRTASVQAQEAYLRNGYCCMFAFAFAFAFVSVHCEMWCERGLDDGMQHRMASTHATMR